MANSPFHNLQDLGEVHRLSNWFWADATARTSEVVTTDDIGKFGLQNDTGEYYELTAVSPDTWILRMGAGKVHDPVTLSTEVDAVFDLSAQQLDFNIQTQNTFLAGPESGPDTKPAFRVANLFDMEDVAYTQISTTGSGVKPIQSVLVLTDTTVALHTIIVGRQTGGTAGSVGDSLLWIVSSLWKDIGGTLTQVGPGTLIDSQNDGVGFTGVSYTTSFNQAVIQFTLASDTDIDWTTKTVVTRS